MKRNPVIKKKKHLCNHTHCQRDEISFTVQVWIVKSKKKCCNSLHKLYDEPKPTPVCRNSHWCTWQVRRKSLCLKPTKKTTQMTRLSTSLQRYVFFADLLEVASIYDYLNITWSFLCSLNQGALPQLKRSWIRPSTSKSWCHPVRTKTRRKQKSGDLRKRREDAECQRNRNKPG